MKKFLTLCLIAFTLLACKKKEETPDGPAQWIVGYWMLNDLEVSGNITVAGTAIPVNGDGKNFAGGFNLKSDNSATYDASCDIELVIPGLGTQTIPFQQAGSGNWKLTTNNTKLEVTNGTSTTVYPIKVLTNNIMILEQDSTFNMMGVSGTLNYEVTLMK
jgi:hypothetical protein